MFCRCENYIAEIFNSLFKEMEEAIYVKITFIQRIEYASGLASKKQ